MFRVAPVTRFFIPFAIGLGVSYSSSHAAEPFDPLLKVKVYGTAMGTDAKARSNAIAHARVEALGLALESMLGESYAYLSRPLAQQQKKYVQTSRLIRFDTESGTTRALVEIYLRNQELRADVAAAIMPVLSPKPLVLILVAEEIAGQTFLNAWESGVAEETLVAAFRASGFRIMDTHAVRSRYSAPELLRSIQSPPAAAARFGRENRADILVFGTAVTQRDAGAARRDVRRIVAETHFRVIRVQDGALLDERRTKAGVHAVIAADGARLAIRDATHKSRMWLMVASVLGMVNVAAEEYVTLVVESLGSQALFRKIQNTLENFPGVSSVDVLRLSAAEARVEFRYRGKMRPLVEAITGIDDAALKLEVLRIVGSSMEFRAVAR